jgi:hypothetical protein
MKKVIGASVIVLVLAAGSFAAVGDIVQSQEWALGLQSLATFTQGAGSATTDQHLNLFDTQMAGNVGLGTWGTQMAAGGIGQTGTVAGNCILGSVSQDLAIDGSLVNGFGQVQSISPGGVIAQSQGVGVLGKQDLVKADGGDGSVDGTNDVHLMMSGAGSTICSNMCALSTLCGEQKSQVAGGPCSTGAVSTVMTAGTSQVQQVN